MGMKWIALLLVALAVYLAPAGGELEIRRFE